MALGTPVPKDTFKTTVSCSPGLTCSVYTKITLLSTRETLPIHTGKGFGITAFNDSKKYYSLTKVSIDS